MDFHGRERSRCPFALIIGDAGSYRKAVRQLVKTDPAKCEYISPS
jgi:hypothetical protein